MGFINNFYEENDILSFQIPQLNDPMRGIRKKKGDKYLLRDGTMITGLFSDTELLDGYMIKNGILYIRQFNVSSVLFRGFTRITIIHKDRIVYFAYSGTPRIFGKYDENDLNMIRSIYSGPL